ncbi:hypothetical protein ACQ5SP_09090 [Rhodovulum sp. YNF3179]
MRDNLFALSLGFGGLILATLWAAQSGTAGVMACGDRQTVIDRLETRFGETRQSIGLGRGDRVVELFASTETGSWTIIVTRPDGVSCLLATGDAFEDIIVPQGDPV